MACCGKKRAQFQAQVAGPASTSTQPQAPMVRLTSTSVPAASPYRGHGPAPVGAYRSPSPVRLAAAYFQYVGRTGLTAIGSATGKHYRFDGPGARVPVDPRDIPSLRTVPLLKQI